MKASNDPSLALPTMMPRSSPGCGRDVALRRRRPGMTEQLRAGLPPGEPKGFADGGHPAAPGLGCGDCESKKVWRYPVAPRRLLQAMADEDQPTVPAHGFIDQLHDPGAIDRGILQRPRSQRAEMRAQRVYVNPATWSLTRVGTTPGVRTASGMR
jgi:hypothetical protein